MIKKTILFALSLACIQAHSMDNNISNQLFATPSLPTHTVCRAIIRGKIEKNLPFLTSPSFLLVLARIPLAMMIEPIPVS